MEETTIIIAALLFSGFLALALGILQNRKATFSILGKTFPIHWAANFTSGLFFATAFLIDDFARGVFPTTYLDMATRMLVIFAGVIIALFIILTFVKWGRAFVEFLSD